MTRYTVVWHVDAQNQLAQCWMNAADRSGVTQSADAVDAILAWDPLTKGTAVEGELQELILPPLQSHPARSPTQPAQTAWRSAIQIVAT
jgi:hypothetical protein